MNPYHLAIETLLKNNINELPVKTADVETILNLKGWKLIAYDLSDVNSLEKLQAFDVLEHAKQYKAFSYKINDLKIVFYRIDLSANARAFALAHELGHICFAHFSDTGILGKHTDDAYNESQEIEADHFARSFLAPICILKKLHATAPDDIERYTMLDFNEAELQAGACKLHKNFSEKERHLIGNFKMFLDHHTEKHKIKAVILFSTIVVFCISVGFIGYVQNQQKNDIHVWEPHASTSFTFAPGGNVTLINGSEYGLNMPVYCVKSKTEVFHKKGCSYIAGKTDLSEMAMQSAVAAGLRPCSRCF